MKQHHTARLSWLLMAGCMQSVSPGAWLLLVPPINMNGIVDTTQPLSEWRPARDFETQIDCNAFLQAQQFMVHSAYGPLTSGTAQNPDEIQAVQILNGQCIVRNDPRLQIYPHS